MATVFLSYAREDTVRVRPLAAALEKDGHIVWWDEQIAGGDQFTQAIQDALDKADAVVVAWSKTSVQSAWVRDEAAHGRDSGKLVPVSIDGSLPPLGFREYQAIDLSSWSGRNAKPLDPVKKAIAAKGGRKGRKRKAEVAKPTTRSRPRHIWAIAATAAVAAVTAVGLVASGVVDTPLSATREQPPSIAVLPFTDLSPARDKAYFAEGVAEEILSTLAAEQGIRVLGRSSARQIGRDGDPGEWRKKLGITHLLEGSARSAGDQLRVNVRLIDTSDRRQLWEEEYQGRPADIFAVQDQIAGAVVQRLRGTLGAGNVRAAMPTDAETFQAYLAARSLTRTRNVESLKEALELAEGLVRKDQSYAPGHALIAELHHLLSDAYNAYGTVPADEARKRAIPHAREAIRLAPDAPEGYAALGVVTSHSDSIAPLKRAIALDPSRAEVRMWLGFRLNELGRHDEALTQYRAAADIDPLNFAPIVRFVHALAAAGRQQEALGVVQRYVARGGDEALRYPMLIEIANWQADPSAVVAHGRAGLAEGSLHHDYFRLFVAAALNAVGQGKQAASILPANFQSYHAPYYTGDLQRLRRNINRDGTEIWKSKAAGFAFTHLARERDWPALARLFDGRPFSLAAFCEQWPNYAGVFAMALQAERRPAEARNVLQCLRARLAIESRMTERLPEGWPGDFEFRRATLSALENKPTDALRWLERAVGAGWLGQPYSSRLADYPQFDSIRSDRRFAALQRRIDSKIAKERTELLAQR